jgi:glyoxylase-like metal-dependent hydrolase (beta-lactamase superfamily II)
VGVLRVIRILAPNPDVYTLEGTNTWVVGEAPSVVIDPGPDVVEHLEEVARAAGSVSAVLVTHDHPDHAPGAARFATMVNAPLHAFRLKGAHRLRDGHVLRAGALEITTVHTPGHTGDHLAFWSASDRALFTGDAVLGRGTSFIDPPEGDLVKYLRSLERMRDLHPQTIYPGHGPVVLDAKAKLAEYLSHRAERQEQVLAAMAGGPSTISAMVERIYAEYPTDVHALAARSVLAHLLKLESEGRAQRKGTGDDATWTASTPHACDRCGRPVRGRAKLCGPCSLAVLQDRG